MEIFVGFIVLILIHILFPRLDEKRPQEIVHFLIDHDHNNSDSVECDSWEENDDWES